MNYRITVKLIGTKFQINLRHRAFDLSVNIRYCFYALVEIQLTKTEKIDNKKKLSAPGDSKNATYVTFHQSVQEIS